MLPDGLIDGFKIDLIVWKLLKIVFLQTLNFWFKIDLIVWKYTIQNIPVPKLYGLK